MQAQRYWNNFSKLDMTFFFFFNNYGVEPIPLWAVYSVDDE